MVKHLVRTTLLAAFATMGSVPGAFAQDLAPGSGERMQAPPPPPPPPGRPLRPDSPAVPEPEREVPPPTPLQPSEESATEEAPPAEEPPPTSEPAPDVTEPSPPAEAAPQEPPPAQEPAPAQPGPAAPPPTTQTPTAPPATAPAATPKPEEPPPSAEPPPPEEPTYRFIKGDLIYPGTRRLLSRYDHFGVALGGSIIDSDLYVSVAPGMAWYFDFGLSLSLHVPLNLLAVVGNGGQFEFGGLLLRSQDWDEPADFAKVVRFITYGRKEDPIYATINTMRPSTIGHGILVNRYQGDIDVDRSLTRLILEAYNEYGGFQLQANDITFQNQIFGGLAFIKPLSFFTDNLLAQSLSLGVEYVADLKAPRCVKKNQGADPDACVQANGHFAGFSEYGGARLDDTFVRTVSRDQASAAGPYSAEGTHRGRFLVEEALVHALGASAEFKFYKDERNVDLKAYTTFHQYLNEGGGDGESAGVLARLNFGEVWRSAMRLRAEFRTYDDGFLPAYFDSLYEIQKYAFLYPQTTYQVTPTKYQWVFGDPENGFERQSIGRRYGFNADLNYALFENKRSGKLLGLGLGLEESTGPYDTNFYAHVEANLFSYVQLFATYLRTNLVDVGALFDDITSQDAILLAGLRVQVLPIMFINAHYSRSFRVTRTAGAEYHLGNGTILDPRTDAPSPESAQDRLFENVQTLFVEVELGWEFSDDEEEKEEEEAPASQGNNNVFDE